MFERLFSQTGLARLGCSVARNLFCLVVLAADFMNGQTAGTITSVAGGGSPGTCPLGDACVFEPDGGVLVTGVASTIFIEPIGDIATDSSGNVYFSDSALDDIRKLTPSGNLLVVAGGQRGFSGDNGPAAAAKLYGPRSVAIDLNKNMYIAELVNNRIRKVTAGGTIITLAGNGQRGFSGDNGPATSAELSEPYSVTVDINGVVYFSDFGNTRVRKITPDGIISTVAGTGISGLYTGDNGPATSAVFEQIQSIAVDSAGNLYLCDSGDRRLLKVNPSGIISTVAGTGRFGPSSGDGGLAINATLAAGPRAIAIDGGENIFITDGSTVRKITSDGLITTVVGTGGLGFSGDNGPALSAQLDGPTGLGVDSNGNLYISDDLNNRVRKVIGIGAVLPPGGPNIISLTSILLGVRLSPLRLTVRGSSAEPL